MSELSVLTLTALLLSVMCTLAFVATAYLAIKIEKRTGKSNNILIGFMSFHGVCTMLASCMYIYLYHLSSLAEFSWL